MCVRQLALEKMLLLPFTDFPHPMPLGLVLAPTWTSLCQDRLWLYFRKLRMLQLLQEIEDKIGPLLYSRYNCIYGESCPFT